MRLVRLLARQSALEFFLCVFGSFASAILILATLAVISKGLHVHHKVDSYGARLIWLSAAAVATRWLSRLALGRLSRAAMFQMRLKLAAEIANAPLTAIEDLGTTRLMSAFTQDITELAAALPNAVAFFSNLVFLTCTLGLLAWISPLGAGELISVMAIGILSNRWLRSLGEKHRLQMNEEWDQLLRVFESLTFGIKEVQLDADRRNNVLARMHQFCDRVRDYSGRQSALYVASANWTQLLFFLAIWLVVFHSSSAMRSTPHALVTYGVAIVYLMLPMRMVLSLAGTFADADAALGRLEELGFGLGEHLKRTPAWSSTQPDGRDLDGFRRELGLHAVTYRYLDADRTSFLLGPINLSLHPGEIVFIVGGNGSGKTTLAKLLTGLYEPEEGSITVDGQPLEPLHLQRYRNQVAAIFTDFYSFVELPRGPSVEMLQRSRDILVRLKVDHIVQLSEDGTFSRTRGLSSGERKRLALAIALLQDRPIYLFDEWAADQDPPLKEFFYRELLPELKARNKLVIVITHDQAFFAVADQLVRLERSLPPIVELRSRTSPSRAEPKVEVITG
jgi:putative pyoverdin transport system ATP-binding/permease protein